MELYIFDKSTEENAIFFRLPAASGKRFSQTENDK